MNYKPHEALLDYVDTERKLPILDLACGTGRSGLILARRNIPVVFADRSDTALNVISRVLMVTSGCLRRSLTESVVRAFTVNVDLLFMSSLLDRVSSELILVAGDLTTIWQFGLDHCTLLLTRL